MYEDDIKLVDEWFDKHTENYGTYHNDNEYSVCAYDLDEFSDFLRENFPDMIGIRCYFGKNRCYFGKNDSAIWFFRDDLDEVRFADMRCINADELLSWFNNHYDDEIVTIGYVTGLIKDSPTVEPERKTGKWIKLDMHAHLADHKCTACGQECYVPTCMEEPMYIYCPYCGAKMDGGEQE